MGVTVKDSDTGWSQFLTDLDNLKRNPAGEVDVGWFSPELAERAALNEFYVPAPDGRPFVRPTVDQNKKKYLKMMTRAAERVVDGMSPEQALIPTANKLRNDIINKIITLRTPPNAQSTIDAKGSSNPLVDTGEMQRSIQIKTGGK